MIVLHASGFVMSFGACNIGKFCFVFGLWFFCSLYHCSCRHELVFSQWGCLFPLCFTLQDHLSLTNLCKVQEGALPILEG